MECIEVEKNALLGTFGNACRAMAVLAGVMVAVWIAYVCVGHYALRLMYDGNVPAVLKKFVAFSHDRPLEHYQRIADCMVIRGLMVLSTGVSLAMLLHQNVYRRKSVHVLFLSFSLMVLQATVYVVNPLNRVYSIHGFFHASILYQILNGSVPPTDPLFAGSPLHYPWAHEFLVGHLAQLFGISPFYVYAIVNCCALGVFVFVIYKIARFLIDDDRACIFAAFISVCASTIWPGIVLKVIVDSAHLGHCKATPAIYKFFNINALPLGQVFFFWSVYLFMRVFAGRKVIQSVVLLFVASLGCGFFYCGFLPCIMMVAVVMAAGRLVLKKSVFFAGSFRPVVFSFMVVGLACLCVWPYMVSSTSGANQNVEFFNPVAGAQNIVKYILITLPLIIIILTKRRYLLEHCLGPGLGVLLSVLLTVLGCYLFIHVSNGAEYKFLLLSLVALGIPGGLAFYRLRDRLHLAIFMVLLCLFLLPVTAIINKRIHYLGNSPLRFYRRIPEFVEDGVNLGHRDPDHDQLYKWIMAKTSTDAVFIDTSWDVPVYGRRRLFVAMTTSVNQTVRGYRLTTSALNIINGFDLDVHTRRMQLVRNIYGYDDSIDRKEILDILCKDKIYVIARSDELPSKFNSEGLKEVFRSSGGGLKVYVCENDRAE